MIVIVSDNQKMRLFPHVGAGEGENERLPRFCIERERARERKWAKKMTYSQEWSEWVGFKMKIQRSVKAREKKFEKMKNTHLIGNYDLFPDE